MSYESNAGARFGFTLAKGETETFIVSARSKHGTYHWRLEIGIVVDGTRKTIQVGPAGGFVTTANPTGGFWDWNFQDAWMLMCSDGTVDETRSVPAAAALPSVS